MSLPQFSAKHPVTIAMLVCGVLLLGFVSLNRLGTDLLPDLDSPRISVALESGNKSPREMEDTYAEQLEAQLGTVRHVRSVRSVSYVGRIVVTVEFAWHTDMDFALLEIHKQVVPYSGDREVDNVVVSRFDPRQLPVLTFGVLGTTDYDLDSLRRIGEDTIQRRLEGLDGVAAARVSGGRERIVVVQPDPYLLKSHDLTYADLKNMIQAANMDASGGEIEDNEQMYIVHTVGEFQGLDDIRNVIVGYRTPNETGERSSESATSSEKIPIPLSEVASVGYDYKEVKSIVRLNGRECIGISVYKEPDENTVRVVESIRAELKRIERDVPDVSIIVADDQARFIEVALREVYQTTFYGILLAIVVLYAFLRNFRSTLIVCLAIPISIIGTFNLMYYFDLTLNIMTLGGLALGAGMLVDSAIVVVENIFRHRQKGESMLESAIAGTSEVGGAITAATVTTVVVFLPIVFVRGIAGELFKEQAMTVGFSLLSSLIVALVVIPAAASRLLTTKNVPAEQDFIRYPRFAAAVGKCVDHRYLVVLFAICITAGAVYYVPRVGSEFVPSGDEGQFAIKLRLPEGALIETTEKYVRHIERAIESTAGSEVETVLVRIGQTQDEMAVLDEEASGDNVARMSVVMKQPDKPEGRVGKWAERLGLWGFMASKDRRISSEALVSAIDPLVKTLPDTEINYVLNESTLQQTIGSGEAPITVQVRGPNLAVLRSLTEDIAGRIEKLPELYNVSTSFEGGHPEVEIILDRLLTAGFGLDTGQLAAIVQQKTDGEVVGDFVVEDEQRDIEMKFEELSLRELSGIEVENAQGALLTLGDIATLNTVEGPRTIERREQQRAGIVSASLSSGSKFSEAITAIREALAEMDTPRNYRIEVTGEE
ncbi:MAG: efflux RND transporter permease subunit, partial [Candidatus Hydrogenedentota bacterium]